MGLIRDNNKNLIESFYKEMSLMRHCEQSLLDLYSKGKIRGTVHTCIGQEATACGVISALNIDNDIICSNHRGHGHFLAFTKNYKGLIAEIMGLKSGVCGGSGGSQHIHQNNYYSSGVLGGMPPVACGIALSEKLLGSDAVVTVFLGDGAMAEGNIYESLNLASVFNLPLLFAIEQNQYAQSTASKLQHGGILEDRANSFGVPVTVVNGNDVIEVNNAAKNIIKDIRTKKHPQMLFMNTYRLSPHSKGDDNRAFSEIEEHRKFCPLSLLSHSLDKEWMDIVNRKSSRKIEQIVASLLKE